MTHEDAMTLLQELTSEDTDRVTHAVLVALPLKVLDSNPAQLLFTLDTPE